MLYENVELHNVAEVQPVNGGVRPQRVPETVRSKLLEAAQLRAREPENCEIRFVCDPEPVELVVSSEGETDLMLFYGPFDPRIVRRITREPRSITLPPPAVVGDLDRRYWGPQQFDPRVYRIMFGGMRRDPVIIHSIKGRNLRPPAPEQVPCKRYLVYGTSITQGYVSDAVHLNYVSQAAWHLGVDLINLGMSGAAQCEPAFADYIAQRDDWDIATLGLSVNMRYVAMPEFRDRVKYFVHTVAGADTARPVACITIFPYWPDLGMSRPEDKDVGGTADEYRQCLRDIVAACPHPNVQVIEGPELLRNVCGLSADLIHPTTNGMIEIGRRLAERLSPFCTR